MSFTDGDILSASQLNDLVARVNALEDGMAGVNLGFAEVTLSPSVNEAYFEIVHRYDWLHIQCNFPNDDVDLDVYYDATNVAALDSDVTGTNDVTVNVDISGAGLTLGQQYTMKLVRPTPAEDGDTADVTVYYVVEAETEL